MGKVTYKTYRQKTEYDILQKKKEFIINWRIKNAGELKTANKHYYLGGVTKKEQGLLQLSNHYDKKMKRIQELMKHT